MAGLVDIAPIVEKVTICGTVIEVPGVSAEGIAVLLSRFPELRKLLTGVTVDSDALLKAGPGALAAILAAGTGVPGDEEAEAAAARLPLGDQADLLTAVLRVTLPGGLDPFVEKLSSLGLIMAPKGAPSGAGGSGRGQGSKSRKRSKR